MPHQCVRCSTFYPDGANEIIKGCTCGGRLFFFVKKQAVEEAKNAMVALSDDDKREIEDEVFDIIGDKDEYDEHPVILDFESIRILEPGKYEIDLVNLFKKEPLIYSSGEGKYSLDLKEIMEKYSSKKNQKRRKINKK